MENKITIDNVVAPEDFEQLQGHFSSPHFDWYFNSSVVKGNTNAFQFVHAVYVNEVVNYNDLIALQPINNVLQPQSLLRIKANLSTKGNTHNLSGMHIDNDVPGALTAVYYINTNNGYTEFEDGDRVESVENRLVVFPSRLKHSGVNCTDEQRRIVININYVPYYENNIWQSLMTKEDKAYREYWGHDTA